jgi:hypothetical protein
MRAAYVADGGHPDDFTPAGPNSSARTIAAQESFYAHQPPPAAYPGTSNHGWAIAVDVRTKAAAAWLYRHVAAWGWSHDEGLRVGEWWHFRYVGAPKSVLRRLRSDALAGYTASERRWIREYDRLKRERRDVRRRRVLRRVMTEQRKRIWREAQRTGWKKSNRRQRYHSLLARTR